MTSPPPLPPPPPPRGMTSYALAYQYPGMELYGAYAYQCQQPPGPGMPVILPYWYWNGSQYPPPPPPGPGPGPGMLVMPPYWNGSQCPPPPPPCPGPGPGPGMPPYQYPPATGYPYKYTIPPPNSHNSSSFMKGALLGKLIYETAAADALTGSEDLHFLS